MVHAEKNLFKVNDEISVGITSHYTEIIIPRNYFKTKILELA